MRRKFYDARFSRFRLSRSSLARHYHAPDKCPSGSLLYVEKVGGFKLIAHINSNKNQRFFNIPIYHIDGLSEMVIYSRLRRYCCIILLRFTNARQQTIRN